MVKEYIEKSGSIWPDYHSNPEMMVNTAGLMYTDAGLDNIVVPFGMFIESHALGLEVKWEESISSPQYGAFSVSQKR